MRVSKEWLEEYVTLPTSVTPEVLANDITVTSVEVEEVLSYAQLLENIVVGRVVAIEKHPNADSLYCCQVDVGGSELVPVVCGGGNLTKDMFVALGLVGARVRWHGEGELVTLKKTKIRGEISLGMICAAEEIGLELLFSKSDEKDILDLSFLSENTLGVSLVEALDLEDYILDIENKTMTHRPDLWGHYGLARECSALYNVPLHNLSLPEIVSEEVVDVSVRLVESEKCTRYMAVVLENLEHKEAPFWMRRRLAVAGVRSINAIVDVTNYVMLELGQPLHAFDINSLASPDIVIRHAKAGEEFVALGGEAYELAPDMLVVADKEKTIALAGVKGGEYTGVTEKTTSILLEAAHFTGKSVRRTSSQLGLRTEASSRFEKNLDPLLVESALKRAIVLFTEIFPNIRIVSRVCDEQSFVYKEKIITISLQHIRRMIGCEIESSFVVETLQRLGFEVEVQDGIFSVSIPSWRATGDISIPEDIIEEIARMYGYGNIPEVLPLFPILPAPESQLRDTKKALMECLTSVHSCVEHYSYAFVSPDWLERLSLESLQHIVLENPLAKDKPLLRRSILPNMLESAEKNFHRFDEVRLCELGPVFDSTQDGAFTSTAELERLPKQHEVLGIVFGKRGVGIPFFVVSDMVTDSLRRLGIENVYLRKKHDADVNGLMHPGRCADIIVDGIVVGVVAEVHPSVQTTIGIPYKVAFAEIFIELILEKKGGSGGYAPISAFPVSQRDLAVTVAGDTLHDDVLRVVSGASNLVMSVELFDVYVGENLGDNRKSMAYHIVYGLAERTLTSEEVANAHLKVVSALEIQCGAVIRE